MTYLYLALNIASFSVPFLYSFEKRMRFIKWWKSVFLAIFLVAIPFLIWDVIFTKYGIWGFNPKYHLGIAIFGLPLEEILFFICIPYASIFTHYAFQFFFPNTKLSNKFTKAITVVLLVLAVIVLLVNFPKAYTTVDFSLFSLLMLYALFSKSKILNTFYITFLLVLIPFFIVNGLLTGSFIHQEVVWYNNAENMGIRVGTVPVEDAFYAFSMLYMALILIEKFKGKFIKR
ncbi:lycopene cyclase domain-containing protein [Lutibacter sp. HS1-25]|uniref:lycopene cyclase domain-containing protein n=1 Tax=Lutibacter sp. HS1-25 TaxID=2485000 RepID=UPI0010111252|nr:lycopene cyclase domain-containing protein [Lutibacter sp. HS1-25]RXP61928.1 lycopene cyclase domain-containing protein [Lutibacter sp. HS1-25]